jgi:uroporphyrinogen-III synthase
MRVLVTRPREDGEDTARRLAMLGHEAVLAPLLATAFFDGPPLDIAGVQAILATSANSIRAFIRRSAERDIPLFAVGPQTSAEAQAAGFTNVRNADGDVQDLARAVMAHADPAKGPLLHIRGENSKAELASALTAKGFALRPEILYAVRPLDLQPDILAALRAGSVEAVLLFSPVSAGVFRDALQAAGISGQGLVAVCISAAAAEALAPLEFAGVRVAARPNQDFLLDCLQSQPC